MTGDHYGAASRFTVNAESCDNPVHYESYIKQSAITDNKLGLGTTYIFCNSKEDDAYDIMGFVTIKASSLVKEMGQDEKMGYPALEISELAVDERYERQGIGRDMVDFIIGLAGTLNSEYLGIQYLLLCADPKSVGFYKKLGFQKISNMEAIPRELWNQTCVPMSIKLFKG